MFPIEPQSINVSTLLQFADFKVKSGTHRDAALFLHSLYKLTFYICLYVCQEF